MYRDEIYSLQNFLSMTQAGPGRTVKQEQEESSPNHVQRINLISVEVGSSIKSQTLDRFERTASSLVCDFLPSDPFLRGGVLMSSRGATATTTSAKLPIARTVQISVRRRSSRVAVTPAQSSVALMEKRNSGHVRYGGAAP